MSVIHLPVLDFAVCGERDDELVIVDVELSRWIRSTRSLEGDADEVLAEDVLENGRAHGAILIEDLVHDVPVVDLALVAGYHLGDVVLQDGRQRRLVGDLRHPARELRVPAQRVATNQLAVRRRPVDEVIGGGPVEAAPACCIFISLVLSFLPLVV